MAENRTNTEKKGFLDRVKIKEKDYEKSQKTICRKILKDFYDSCNNDNSIKANILGNRIKVIRKLKGMTQSTLAEKSYIDRGTIISIESGKQKSLSHFETIECIVNALDYDLEEFVAIYKTDSQDGKSYQDEKKWEKFQQRNFYVDESGLEKIELLPESEINYIKAEIFSQLDVANVYYEDEHKKILVPEKYVELLRMNIFNAFETLDYLLKKG